MKQINYFLCSISLMAIFSCGIQKETVVEEKPADEMVCQKSLLDVEEYRRAKDDPYTLISAKLDGDCLVINVSYSGGCDGADFKLVGHKTQTKMPPPIYLFRLALDDQDYCRSIVRKTLQFDVAYLRDTGNELVTLQLKNWAEIFEIRKH